jgi:hypothetical protein
VTRQPLDWLGRGIVLWGLGGTLLVLVQGLGKVGRVAWELADGPAVSPLAWLLTVPWVVFMAYTEGYRGFYLAFSPRAVARAWAIGREPTLARALLAPLICMGLWQATRRRLTVSWGVLVAVIGAVILIRLLPYPVRSLADLGVFIGLGLGALSLALHWARAAAGHLPQVPSDLP